jgi:hypothetical protein
MIRTGNVPSKMAKEEIAEYKRIMHEMHPEVPNGTLDITIDGDDVLCTLNPDTIPFERIRRITGYLVGDVSRWNNAKTAELHDRVKHRTGENNDEI